MEHISQQQDASREPVSPGPGPNGDDLDRLREMLELAIRRDPEEAEPADPFLAEVAARLPSDFWLDPDDDVIKRSTRDGPVAVSHPFLIRHLAVARAGRPAQLLVAMRLASGQVAEVRIPADDIGKGSPKGVAMLRGAGLRIFASDARFADLLRAMPYETINPPALKPGWVSQSPPAYCLIDGSVVARETDIAGSMPSAPLVKIDQALLHRWLEEVAALLSGNYFALFVICQQFSGPLLRQVGAETVIFNLAARTSQAKSFLIQVAARMWPKQPIHSWTATRASLDDACLAANDGALILDEIPKFRSTTKTAPTVFSISNGIARSARAAPGREQEQQERRIWVESVITSSEHPFWTLAVNEARKTQGPRPTSELVLPVQEGTFVRLVDIGGKDQVIWRNAHGHSDIAALLTTLDIASKETVGIAGPAFVKRLLDVFAKEEVARLRSRFEHQARLIAQDIGLRQGTGISPEMRVMRHFAGVMLAGELAVEFGLLPQTCEQVQEAVLEAAHSWARIVGAGKHQKEEDPVALIRAWAWPRLGKDLREVDGDRRPVDRKPWGAKGWFNGEYYFFLRETLQDFVPGGATFKELRDLLEACGALVADDGSPSKQVRMSRQIGPDIRVYQLRRDVIDRREDDRDEEG
jgi:hypothetical protein